MQRILDIEHAIEQLSPEELHTLRAWFDERDAAEWDRQLENDIAAGKLDSLADEALRDFHNGRCTDL